MSLAEVKQSIRLLDYVAGRQELQRDGGRYKGHCPFHDDPNPSFKLYPEEDKWHCYGCDRGGDLIDYAGHERFNGGWNPRDPAQFREVMTVLEAYTGMVPVAPQAKPKSREVARRTEYDYRRADGTLAYQAIRTDYTDGSKGFSQRRPDGNGDWVWKLGETERLPYRLSELLATPEWDTAFIVEGEKCVEAIRALGFTATCNSEGAGKWRSELNGYFRNRRVVILTDNDPVGEKHGEEVAENLSGVAASVKKLALPGLLPKQDVADWLGQGHTADELFMLAVEAPEFCSGVPDSTQEHGNKSLEGWRAVLRPVATVLQDKVTAAEWAVDRLIPLGWLILLAGRTKVGKTLLMIALANAIATGGEFLGRKCRKGAVVLVLVDDPPALTHPRLEALKELDNVFVYTGRWNDQVMPAVRAACQEIRPSMVVLDALVKMLPKHDRAENDATTTDAVMEQMAALTSEYGCSVVLIHHLSKGGDVRGSTAIESAAPMVIKGKREEGKAEVELEIEWKLEPVEPLLIKYDGSTWQMLGGKREVEAGQLRETLWNLLAEPDEGWGTSQDLAEAAEARKEAVVHELGAMVDSGDLRKEDYRGTTGRARKLYRRNREFCSRLPIPIRNAGTKVEVYADA